MKFDQHLCESCSITLSYSSKAIPSAPGNLLSECLFSQTKTEIPFKNGQKVNF